jgi:hypothetical protein
MTASEINEQIWNLYIQYGLVNRKFTKGRLGLLTSAISTELGVIMSILNSYASQFSIDTVTDASLLESMIKPFTIRRPATYSRVLLTFTRADNYNESVRIPRGFAVSDSGDSTVIFKTASDIYLWKGNKSATGVAYCVNTGSKYNVVANKLTYFSNSEWNTVLYVNNEEPAFGGMDDESLESAKQRANMFRYDRDGTTVHLRSLMYQLGLNVQQYYIEEYGMGYGTILIILDVDSESEFQDIQQKLLYDKVMGVKYYFVRANRRYVNFYVHLKTIGASDYSEAEKENIYTIVQNTIQNIFAYYLSVGVDLSVTTLVTEINTQLSGNYNIYSVSVSFDEGVTIEKNNKIKVSKYERVYTNKIVTDITYIGE